MRNHKSQLGGIEQVLLRPHVTEKATDLATLGVYAFEIGARANKKEVAIAIKTIYGVTPRGVHMVRLPRKEVASRRGKKGSSVGIKKAYVYLKDGDKIEFV